MSTETPASGAGTTQAGGAAPTTTPDAGGQQATQPQGIDPAEFARLKADHAALLTEVLEKKRKAKDAESAAAKSAEEQGQYREALEATKKRLAELEELEPLARRYQEHEKQERERMDARIANLPELVQVAVKAAGTLEAQRAVLDAFDSLSPGSTAPKAAIPPGGNPAPAGTIDFRAAFASPALWAEARAKDPAGAAAYEEKITTSGRKPASFAWRPKTA